MPVSPFGDSGWGSARLPQIVADIALDVSNRDQAQKYGAGAPAASLATAVGQYYFRTDTPTITNQRIYVATAIGVWVGIV